jgi:hypothetical protein
MSSDQDLYFLLLNISFLIMIEMPFKTLKEWIDPNSKRGKPITQIKQDKLLKYTQQNKKLYMV